MEDTDTNRIAHLQLIQGVINRLAGNASLVKGWSVTLVLAIGAVATARGSSTFAFLALFPALVFWSLDAYYLTLERRFRRLYDHVRTGAPGSLTTDLFTMDTSAHATEGYLRLLWRLPLAAFHLTILASVVAFAVLVSAVEAP